MPASSSRCATLAVAAVLFLCASVLVASSTYAQTPRSHDYRTSLPGTIQLKSGRVFAGEFALRLDQPPRLLYADSTDRRRSFLVSDVRSFRHGSRYVVNHGVVTQDAALRDDVEEELIVRRVSGRLDLYASLRARDPQFPYAYFSKGDGLIQEVNYKNLRVALRDDPASAALIASSRTWHWAHRGLFAGGTALALWGAFRVPSDNSDANSNVALAVAGLFTGDFNFRPDAVLLTGLGMVALSFIPRALKTIKFRKAIRTYNR